MFSEQNLFNSDMKSKCSPPRESKCNGDVYDNYNIYIIKKNSKKLVIPLLRKININEYKKILNLDDNLDIILYKENINNKEMEELNFLYNKEIFEEYDMGKINEIQIQIKMLEKQLKKLRSNYDNNKNDFEDNSLELINSNKKCFISKEEYNNSVEEIENGKQLKHDIPKKESFKSELSENGKQLKHDIPKKVSFSSTISELSEDVCVCEEEKKDEVTKHTDLYMNLLANPKKVKPEGQFEGFPAIVSVANVETDSDISTSSREKYSRKASHKLPPIKKTVNTKIKVYNVYYNLFFNKCIILESSNRFFSENKYLCVEEIEKIGDDTHNIKKLEKYFINTVDSSKIKNILEKHKYSSNKLMENRVKNYIYNVFNITNNINNKVKANKINEELQKEFKIEPSNKISFRNKLGPILENIGLQKHRFSDGNYYYGLVRKREDL